MRTGTQWHRPVRGGYEYVKHGGVMYREGHRVQGPFEMAAARIVRTELSLLRTGPFKMNRSIQNATQCTPSNMMLLYY